MHMHPLVTSAIPADLREARYRIKRLGWTKSLRYYGIEWAEQRKPPPLAGQPFDIGGGQIVLHAETVRPARSHWVDYAHGVLELRAFKRCAADHRLLLDIGAAEGIYSAAFCALTGREAWAFEPSPEMLGRLAALCALNPGFAITRVPVALDATTGKRAIRRSPDGQFSGVGALTPADVMTVTTIDAFVADQGIDPDFAKIDVEGMELDVLLGGETTFRDHIRTILLEVHYDLLIERGQSTSQLQAVLAGYGFHLETLDGLPVGDLESYARANPEPYPGYTVVVCRRS
jgi:FkbM family methyltransferase